MISGLEGARLQPRLPDDILGTSTAQRYRCPGREEDVYPPQAGKSLPL